MAKISKGLSMADDKLENVMMAPAGAVNKVAKSQSGKTIGGLAFIIGFLLAVIAGLLAGLQAVGVNLGISIAVTGLMTGVLALIGLIVGIVNVSDKEAISFLIGAIAITAAAGSMSALGNLGMGTPAISIFIGTLMNMVAMFVSPAAVIVGLKVVYSSARGA
jgi:hypothetical protein